MFHVHQWYNTALLQKSGNGHSLEFLTRMMGGHDEGQHITPLTVLHGTVFRGTNF